MTEIKNAGTSGPGRAVLALMAMLALLLLPSGCQKAGDGMGLDATGQWLPFCKAHPEDPSCVAVDPCIANPTLPQCLDSCQTTPPAPGCSVDVCKINPSDPSCPPVVAKVKFGQVLEIFKANQCQSCHTGNGSGATTGKLLLSDDVAYANLVNAPPSYPAIAKGWMRVMPSKPDSSVLYLKLTKNPPKATGWTSTYGATMPYQLPMLDTSITNVVKQWILDGAEQ